MSDMMDRDERLLDRLFAAYRDACPAPETSADFMPGIWSRIDGRRSLTITIRRWTSAFVAAATALSIAMVVYMSAPRQADVPDLSATYVDTLQQPANYETLAYAELVSFEVSDPLENQ